MESKSRRAATVPVSFLLLVLFTGSGFGSCPSSEKKQLEEILKRPERQLGFFSFNPESPIASRVRTVDDEWIHNMRDFDARQDYTAYKPTDAELGLFGRAVESLPKTWRQILQERLVGIYFIRDFSSAAFGDFVFDGERRIHEVLILNPAIFNFTVSEWLTYRESTCFSHDDPEIKVSYECETDDNASAYVLLHETAHLLDAVRMLTPNPSILRHLEPRPMENTAFTAGVWRGSHQPEKSRDFALREKITFYGLNDGPKIKISSAAAAYQQLGKTPFPTLYASQNWWEDFAEYATFYYLTNIRHIPCRVTVLEKGKPLYTHHLIESKSVAARFPEIQSMF